MIEGPGRKDRIELSAEWIADMYDKDWEPVAMVHSHPNGSDVPSGIDFQHFPNWMVHTAFVWGFSPRRITQYWCPDRDTGILRYTRREIGITSQGLGITLPG